MFRKKNPLAVVFDDHLLFVESFAAILNRLVFFDAVRGCAEKKAFMRYLITHSDMPVYCFIDFYLSDGISLPLIDDIRRINKQARVIIVSSVTSPAAIDQIRAFEPDGLISKSSGIDIVLACLRQLELNKTYICPAILARIPLPDLLPTKTHFTARELEVLQLFASGLSIAETAERTHLSKHTIVSHRRKLMEKANASSITQLLAYARTHELI